VAAGAFCIVLELVTAPVARELTAALPVPTIGIGSGRHCDGQIQVTPDLIGMYPWVTLKHVQPKVDAARQIRTGVQEWMAELQTRG
jgi:3-methyl-2-oxobutanoate hydroxymethyltransferase